MKKHNGMVDFVNTLVNTAANAPGDLVDAMMNIVAPKPHRHATTPNWVQEMRMAKAEEKRARKAAKLRMTQGQHPIMVTLSSDELCEQGLPRLLPDLEKPL